jgi:hypothetical protein
MRRHELLAALHARLHPRSYLEIGVNDGRSLSLSRVPSVAIDPTFKVTSEMSADVHLARTTSDEFFVRADPLAHFGGFPVDLAFIDGMHLSEFALRDFMNVERFKTPTSVVVLDDIRPRNVDEAARDRPTRDWTGDVFKVPQALRRLRSDLVVLDVATRPTGTSVVLLPDRYSRVLLQNLRHPGHRHGGPLPAAGARRRAPPDPRRGPRRLIASELWQALYYVRCRRHVAASSVRDAVADSGLDLLRKG